MKIQRIAASLVLTGAMSLTGFGAAFASDASVTDTGPGSQNNATINNNNTSTVTNDNDVTVVNDNDQTATSGDATVQNNTNGGSATTGQATNNATANTSVTIGNGGSASGSGGSGGTSGGSGGAGGSGGVSGNTSGFTPGMGGAGGSGAVATLPATGASIPVDVSALRNALGHVAAPAQAVVRNTRATSAALLALAAVLSLMAAVGSAVYANRREIKA